MTWLPDQARRRGRSSQFRRTETSSHGPLELAPCPGPRSPGAPLRSPERVRGLGVPRAGSAEVGSGRRGAGGGAAVGRVVAGAAASASTSPTSTSAVQRSGVAGALFPNISTISFHVSMIQVDSMRPIHDSLWSRLLSI